MFKLSIPMLAAACVLAACSPATQRGEPQRYDFGLAPKVAQPLAGVGTIDVVAPSWLGGEGIEYRLAFADATARRAYVDSRWAAPPAEMLRLRLQQRSAGSGNCRLRVEFDELLQVFDTADSARQHLAVRVALQGRSAAPERARFALEEPTPSADARGAVVATGRLVERLGDDLAAWLAARPTVCTSATDPAR